MLILLSRRQKQNLFPLKDPSKRARNHHRSIDQEQLLFIHMVKENPEDFIEFRGQFAKAINGNRRGQVTINSLGLNHHVRGIPERRLNHLALLKTLFVHRLCAVY